MNGKFRARTETGPSTLWLALPVISEGRPHRGRTTWTARLTWFVIGFVVALILRGL